MTPTPAPSRELKPCPFCGDSPLEDRIEPHEHSDALLGLVPLPFSYPGSWSVECVKCECRIFSHDSREEAVRRWNTRSPQAPDAVALTEAQREAIEAGANALRWMLDHGPYFVTGEFRETQRKHVDTLYTIASSTASEMDRENQP